MPKVTLRKKSISQNRHSLYLDFYPPITNPETGKPTRREFLGLYLKSKPKTQPDKHYNKETLLLAQSITSKRQLDLSQEEYGFIKKKAKTVDFIEYFRTLTLKQKGVDYDLWNACGKYLETFTNGKIQSVQINEVFCNDFREYLLHTNCTRSEKNKLSQNSSHCYFNRFRNSIKQAHTDGILKQDLFPKIKPIPAKESNREYLTQEELQVLVQTDCSLPWLRQAALFSALCGLRWIDIEKLTWDEIRHSNKDGPSIKFRQQKTQGEEHLPISQQALSILGTPGKQGEKVFPDMRYSSFINQHFKHWILKAGITKDITFHNMRHTYATLLLSLGVDIYTLSKMLGHRSIGSTVIYGKVIDKKKQEAANVIKIDL